jgi:hypothetical protein
MIFATMAFNGIYLIIAKLVRIVKPQVGLLQLIFAIFY